MIISQKLFQNSIVMLFCICSLFTSSLFGKNDASKDPVVNGIIKFDVKKLSSFDKLDKIVIDAGHGGKDHGCSGNHSKEKFIVLDIAKRLGALVKFYHPEIEVVYTRDTDVFIPLDTRIDIANKNKADLFISIHANAIHKKHVGGTETYVMGLHRAKENLAVAKRENSAILMENNYEQTYGGYDPNSPEAHILLSMYQNAYLDKSINIATKIENSFSSRTPLKSRGVKQAGFLVLRKATMPSVLVETGFLTNALDEAYLMSEQGKDESADAILKAITQYKREVEGEYWISHQNQPTTESDQEVTVQSPAIVNHVPATKHAPAPVTHTGAQGTNTSKTSNPQPQASVSATTEIAQASPRTNSPIRKSPIRAAKENLKESISHTSAPSAHQQPTSQQAYQQQQTASQKTIQEHTKTTAYHPNTQQSTIQDKRPSQTPTSSSSSSSSSSNQPNRTYSGATGISNAANAVLVDQNPPVTKRVSNTLNPSQSKTYEQQQQNVTAVKVNTSNQKVYRIQIAAGKKQLITGHESKFKNISDLEVRKENDMFKYMTGYYSDLSKAFQAKDTMRNQGFKGAFIVAYQGDSRVSL